MRNEVEYRYHQNQDTEVVEVSELPGEGVSPWATEYESGWDHGVLSQVRNSREAGGQVMLNRWSLMIMGTVFLWVGGLILFEPMCTVGLALWGVSFCVERD